MHNFKFSCLKQACPPTITPPVHIQMQSSLSVQLQSAQQRVRVLEGELEWMRDERAADKQQAEARLCDAQAAIQQLRQVRLMDGGVFNQHKRNRVTV